MQKNRIKLAIFDMDGLLIDSEKVYSEGWLVGIKHYKADLPEDIVYRMNGRSPKQNTALLNSYLHDEDLVQNIRKVRMNYFNDQLAQGKVDLKPFAKELLVKLKDNHYLTALATTTAQKNAQPILEHHDITALFDYTVFGDQVNEVKPAPDLYLNILEQANTSNQEAIILEDSLTGAEAGKNANVNVILIPDPVFTDVKAINDDNIIAVYSHLGETYPHFF